MISKIRNWRDWRGRFWSMGGWVSLIRIHRRAPHSWWYVFLSFRSPGSHSGHSATCNLPAKSWHFGWSSCSACCTLRSCATGRARGASCAQKSENWFHRMWSFGTCWPFWRCPLGDIDSPSSECTSNSERCLGGDCKRRCTVASAFETTFYYYRIEGH